MLEWKLRFSAIHCMLNSEIALGHSDERVDRGGRGGGGKGERVSELEDRCKVKGVVTKASRKTKNSIRPI